jgi:hypothetical protein
MSTSQAVVPAASAGWRTKQVPASNATVTMPVVNANGKFQGEMTAPTPSGKYRNWVTSPGSQPESEFKYERLPSKLDVASSHLVFRSVIDQWTLAWTWSRVAGPTQTLGTIRTTPDALPGARAEPTVSSSRTAPRPRDSARRCRRRTSTP